MAQAAVQLDKQTFSCKICLDFLKDPAILPCGHNYCRSCIQSYWDREGQSSCPQCRQKFSPRPALVTNIVLAELVEQLKKTELKYSPKDLKLGQILHTIQDKETALQKLQQEALSLRHCTDAAVRHSDQRFSTVAQVLKSVHSEVTRQIKELQEREEAQLKQIQDQLQRDITELRKTVSELDSLTPSQTLLYCSPPSVLNPPRTYTLPLGSLEQATSAVTALTDQLQVTLRDGLQNISQSFRSDQYPPPRPQAALSLPEPKTREEFINYTREIILDPNTAQRDLSSPRPQKPLYSSENFYSLRRKELISCAREIVLDPNTAHNELSLSRGNRRVKRDLSQPNYYHSHPDRFSDFCQILSSEGLTGRCYWEVEWDRKSVAIAISYNNIKRKGNSEESEFGYNDKSWALQGKEHGCSFWHDSVETKVRGRLYERIGVYVEHSAGILAFFNIQETERKDLIHSVQTTFTQPLYAGVRFFKRPTSKPVRVYFPKLK